MVKRKRPVQLTAQEKVALIRQYETSDASMRQLAEQYGFKLRHNLKVQQYRVERAATAAAPSAFTASSSTDRILPNVELDFHSPSLDDDEKYLGNLDLDEHLLLSHNQPTSSSSDELIDSSLNVADDLADDTNYPDDDTNSSNSSFDQQMNAELFPSRFPAVTTSEQQQQRKQPANPAPAVTAAPAIAVPVNKEKPPKGPPKGSREEAIEAATTLIRYVTVNTTDFDASSSSFLAKLTGYLSQLINSQPSTEGN
ncbi:hypothetical protein TYRP_012023 [Tyrophagus putrescentiae]|nr:hypothetical protein TYRP_012023 [Tyrophagus putrescentiae]